MIRQAVIFCGGEGTRIRGIRGDKLKCLIEIGERPFIFYIIMMCKGMGATDIVLLAKDKADYFKHLEDGSVRVVGVVKPTVAEELLAVPGLDDVFIITMGDQLPIGNWQGFAADGNPKIAVKIIGRDAGVAIVTKKMVETGEIDPIDFKGMMRKLPAYMMLGTLHIGTPEGIRRAINFIDIAVYGQ